MGDRFQAPRGEGAGYDRPERTSDATGKHPGWFPFQIQVDADDAAGDAADPVPFSDRDLTIGDPVPIDWWPFP